MHKPAKMLSIILQQILLALVLTLSNPFSQSPSQPLIAALPITSKPIENTAENLAWQAWIMLPPQQQNLEKSRKVTPKSIFILPNRVQLPQATTGSNGYPSNDGGAQFLNGEMGSGGYAPIDCPPGQRQFESRCIPTVDIDREQLLIQELQILIQQGGQGGGNNQGPSEYDYDYDDDSMGVGNFEPPLMLNGGVPPIAIGTNYDDADRLPIEDAPLKFNIFREKFPTDGGASAAENSNETSAVFDPMVMMENATIPEGWKAVNITDLWSDLASKFQMENGDEPAGSFFPVALNRADETTSSSTTSTTESTTTKSKSNNTQSFALSDIDAIMLPAATTMQSQHQQHHQHHHQHHQQHANKQQQEFAIFKDDSAMQLIAIEDDRLSTQQQQQKATEIMELLKVDALLPLEHVATGTTVTRSTVTPLPFFSVNAVDKDAAALDAVVAEVTTTTTTTLPTPLAETIAEVETHASQEREKEERTRSVTMRMLEDDDDNTLTTTDEIESNLLTTTTTLSTTIDDELSTIPSNNDATSLQLDAVADLIIQQEIVAVTEQEDPAHEVRKKSKVEPVGVDLFDAAAAAADGDEQTTPLPTPPEFDMLVVPAEVEAEIDSENALNNVAGAAGVADLNRFTEKTTVTVVGAPTALNNEVASVESEVATTTKTTVPAAEITTTTMTATSAQSSEIDIAAELSLINELVKGKRQDTTTTTTTTVKASTEDTTTTTTTTTAKSNIAPIKDINDPIQETTAATSAKTLPTTMKNVDAETTTTTTTSTTTTTPTSSTTPSHKSLAAIESAGNIMMTDTEAESKSNLPTATATTESTATIWSKILPFLSFDSTTTITTPTTADEAPSSSSDTVENSSSNSVRSPANRRNSKIIRINNLSTNEVEQSSNIETTTTIVAASSTTTTTTTELPSTTQSTIDDTTSSTFWWLPIGWSLERNADAATQPVVTPFRTYKNAVTPAAAAVQPSESLLLRFWNAFPGNQKRS